MAYCKLCSEYIGIFTFSYLCPNCADIRRLILLHGAPNMLSFMRKQLLNNIAEKPLEEKKEDNKLEKKEEIEESKDPKTNALNKFLKEHRKNRMNQPPHEV